MYTIIDDDDDDDDDDDILLHSDGMYNQKKTRVSSF